MKISINDELRKNIQKFISKECVEFGIIFDETNVAFVRKENFYDNVKYDVGEDCVYTFLNIDRSCITEIGDNDTSRIFATTRNIENLKDFVLGETDCIKIDNRPSSEKVVLFSFVNNSEVSNFVLSYQHFLDAYQEFGAGLRPTEINSDELKNFISKVNLVKPQNMFILNKGNESMAFVSIFGMMMFKKLGNILPNDYPNINFTTDEAEKIRYISKINGYYVFYDENRRIIKINNTIDSDGYNVIFDRLEIEGKSFKIKRNDFVKILSDINFITFDDEARFKVRFLKTKVKFSVTKSFIVDNCSIEVPMKNSDLTAKTLLLSAEIIKNYVSKTDSEDVVVGIHKEKVLRINSDDINYMFSEISLRDDD